MFIIREEEGIELQVLSNKRVRETTEPLYNNVPLSMFGETAPIPSTDADSLDSGEYEEIEEPEEKPTSTIGMCYLRIALY